MGVNGKIDFSLREETVNNMLGPTVKLVTTSNDGKVDEYLLPVFIAKVYLQEDPNLGSEIIQAHIEFMGVYDEW